MLKRAKPYENEIRDFLMNIDNVNYIKYFNYLCYTDYSLVIPDSEYQYIHRVSVDSKGTLLGYIGCQVERITSRVSNFGLVNITKESSIEFTRDIILFFDDLVKTYRKVSFTVVVGSPAERIYDKIIKTYNGRIVGIQKDEVLLTDHKFYDAKLYEIVRGNNQCK